MVKIKRIPMSDQGSCNFCNRGEIKKDGMGLQYPYETVWIITARRTSFRACDDCMKKIIDIYKRKADNNEEKSSSESQK